MQYCFSRLKIVFVLFSLYLVVDSVNGFMLREGLPSVSMPYKLTLIIITCLLFSLYVKIIVISLIILFYLIYGVISFGFTQTLQGMDWLVKLLSIIYFYYLFKRLFSHDNDCYNRFVSFCFICFFVLAFNVCLGLFGVGYSSYSSSDLGSKGFIYAGNELGFAIILSASVILAKFIHEKNYKSYCYFSLFLIFVSALTAVKVAFISSIIIILIFPLLSLHVRSNFFFVSKKAMIFVSLLYLISPFIIASALYYFLFNVGLWERIQFFWGRTSFIDFILSGRFERLLLSLDIFLHDYSLVEKLFGRGVTWIDGVKVFNNVEIDLFDFLMRYGLFGFFSCLVLILFCLHIALSSNHVHKRYYIVVFFLGLAVSLTAGHVIYSGTASIIMSAFFAQLRVGGRVESSRAI